MKHSNFSRALSLVLALVMVLSMLPASVFASDSAVWTKVDAADITADDTIMVTMTNPNGVTYALYTVQSGTKGNDALVVTVNGDTITTTGTADYGWTVTPVDGGYTLSVDAGYLYTTAANNGVRVGDTAAVWAIDGNYLSTADTGGTTRWLGVYDNNNGDYTAVATPNWRAYKNTTGNTKNQTLGFWKLGGEAAVDPSEPSEPVETEPVELPTYTVSDTVAAGDVVLLYNAGSGTVVTSTASGYKLAGEAVTAEGGVITVDAPAAQWTVGINDDGTYTFSQGELVLGMVQSGTYVNLSTSAADGYTAWTVEDGTGENVHYLRNTNMAASSYGPYYLEYYSGYTAYASSSPSDSAYGIEFYVLGGETVTPDPEPSEPTEPEPTDPPEEAEAPIQDGDKVVLYAPAYNKALSTEKTGFYNVGVDVTVENGVVSGYTETEVFTVIANEDGSFSFEQNGQNIGLAASYSSMDLGAVNDDWNLIDLGDGLYNVQNTVRGNYMEWYDSYGNWSTYNSSSAATDPQFQIAFHVIREEGIVSELHEGDTVVIFNPAHMMALSTAYSGYYNAGTAVTLTDGKLSGYTAADVWTVGVNEDGSYTFSTAAGQKLSLGASYSSMPLDDVNPNWNVTAAATEGCFYIQNTARGNYIEWYADKNNWSSYYNIGSNEALFAQQFYLVVDSAEAETGLPASGDQVVIYNLAAEGVLAAENDTQSIENALATIESGVATPANGGVVFTVSKNESYYRFYNETYGYLCSNGTGNNAFYSLEASEDADWTLTEGKSGGYNMESRTAKYNGTYSQYLEYYADSYKTYSMYNVTDYDIYEFFFYPVAEGVNLTGSIVNQPDVIFQNVQPAYLGQDYSYTFGVDAVFGVETLTVTASVGDVSYELIPVLEAGIYTVTLTAEQVKALNDAAIAMGMTGIFSISISGTDITGAAFHNGSAIDIIDEPGIGDITPASNSQTGADKRPVISAVITNAGEDAAVTMTVGGEAVAAVYENGIVSWTSETDMADGRVSVVVTVTRADGKTATKSWSFTVGEAQFELYFGQLHSHTTYSDGSGSLESALSYIGSLPESANVDFVAFTDHSNYFDTSSAANPEQALYDMSLASASSQELWNAYKGAIADFNASQSDVVAIGGFEMTWSGGPGHINTFATPGIVSRNNATLNNKTSDAGMKAYYALISQAEGVDSISQFNHPGTTFGNFTDFAYWDALVDTRIQLVEVGNGEGQVGAGGYYPSYEQYTMALDKGWHVAPTNNQDNHKGKWGNANDARDVVLTDDFSEEGIYAAIRAYRVYATEDKNLELGYTVNGMVLGSVIEEVPDALNVEVTVYDPDAADSLSKVEVIVNSGKVAYTWDDPAELSEGLLTATLAPDYSYYYLRVTQGDGDIAVTAPVWVGETLKLGISAVECGTATPVTGEELTISTTLFNSETMDANVKSLTYTVGSQVLGVDTTGYTIPASGNTTVSFAYTPDVAKVMNVTVTVVVELDGVEYTFSMDVELDVQDADKLVYIGIDASHYNEYVAGNYKDSMGNFGNLAAQYSVRTVQLNTSEELIAACTNEKYVALILTAPSRRNGSALRDPYATYSDEEIAALKAFNAAGGALILTGWGDYYESYADFPAEDHMAAQQNKILEALGSSIRIADDETKDDTYNGGQSQRLYLSVYDFDSFLLDGVEYDAENPHNNMYTELYSQYGGASIYVVDGEGNPTASVPATVTPAVYGFDTTYSADDDGDSFGGLGQTQKYTVGETEHLMVLASEQLEGQGLIVVAGAAFLSNFEVQATIEDSGAEKNYSNYKICENLLTYLNPVVVTDIADVQAETEEGVKYTIEGVVTSNASGYDKETAFFDCIYLQDGTAGINAFPVAGNYKIGDKVRITGTTSSYQGERQIAVTSIELISEGNTVEPTVITASQLNDGSVLGSLVTLSGTVESFEYANGLVQTIMVKDESGNVGRVFIDGYITTGYDVENLAVGCDITVTGLASYDNSFDGPAPRIRIRDRKDIVCTTSAVTVIATGWSGYTTWELTSDGVLTFTSSGEKLENGESNLRNYWKVNGVLTLPWSDYAEQIVKVVINDGIHDIGQMCFYELPNLTTVELGADVTEIRGYAFKNCVSLTTINLENVDFIREGAFYGCSSLTDVTLGDNVVIEDWAFTKSGVTLN